jgi:hypothetical protein
MAIVAFIVFLVVLGAIGLGVSFVILAFFGRAWRLVARGGRLVSRRGPRQRT